MKRLFLLLLLIISSTMAHSQCSNALVWRSSTDTVAYPKNATNTPGIWISGYDTAHCYYRVKNDNRIYTGYKVVYMKNGYRIDDSTTVGVFFDSTKRPISNVIRYAIRIWFDRDSL